MDFGGGGRVVGSRGNTTLLYLQYGSKYVKYHVIILFVQQRINTTIMATLTSTLTLSSSDISSDALSFSVTDGGTVVAPIENIARITATTTGNASIILPNVDATRYVYIKHLGLNSAGGDSGADQIKVETADGTEIMRISKDEFAFFPHYAGGAGLIQLEATANTVQVEYAYFTRS